jgi:hypothetical protein
MGREQPTCADLESFVAALEKGRDEMLAGDPESAATVRLMRATLVAFVRAEHAESSADNYTHDDMVAIVQAICGTLLDMTISMVPESDQKRLAGRMLHRIWTRIHDGWTATQMGLSRSRM